MTELRMTWDRAAPRTGDVAAAPTRARAEQVALPYGGTGWRGLTSGFAYDSDSLFGAELGGWSPWLRSPDTEINAYRDRRVARTRDIVRNDGWATGAAMRITDTTVGSVFRLIPRPDWRALARESGAAFDQTWASEFETVVKSEWRQWAEDPAFWCHAERKRSLVQIFWLALRHKVVDGESLGLLLWRPEAVGPGAARYATTLQLIDPDRLSNPYEGPDTHTMRGGVEIDDFGAPIAYHVRRAHQNDTFDAAESVTWDRVARETDWGRPVVLHDHDGDRTATHRGVGVLNPVLAKLKMLTRYDAAELQQALLQTVIGTFVTSPYDAASVQNALDAGPGEPFEVGAYQALRGDFHATRSLMIGDARIPTLFPGEKLDSIPPRSPTANFAEFEHAVLRAAASASGLTAEQITQDYSRANYSSLRAAMLEAWKTLTRRRSDFATGFATPVYGAFLEEMIDRNPDLMPAGAPEFMAMRAAYMRCKWIGPGRGWVDPVKERQGEVLGLDAAFGTLEAACADIEGEDWEENVDQRAREIARFHELGIKLPTWAGLEAASLTDVRPQPT